MSEKPLPPSSGQVLDSLRMLGPIPRREVNPGVARLLEGRGLAEEVQLPSPYQKHQKSAKRVRHLRITDAGRALLAAAKAPAGAGRA